jgi:UDP:flavonoid glycosyltransferase YjiC (YdhE family)
MRIAIIAPGSRGDVEPYIALGKGLKDAGHFVRLVSHYNFADLVNSNGLEFWPVDIDVQDIAQSKEMRERLGGGRRWQKKPNRERSKEQRLVCQPAAVWTCY